MQAAVARNRIYRFLSALFQGVPAPETVALLKTEPIIAELERILAEEPGAITVLERLHCVPLDDLIEELAVDYTMLFSAPGATHVPPYESVYRDKLEVVTASQPEINYVGGTRSFEGLYWGDSTVAVAGDYFVADFETQTEIPDSLGLELAFMAHLCAQEVSYREAGNLQAAEALLYRQARFLSQHLMQWVPTFVARVQAKRPHGFYAMAALLTHRYLQAESEQPVDSQAAGD